ncbi:MAG: hypothetical protein SGPRY_012340, partial [Prymnesium sp.]
VLVGDTHGQLNDFLWILRAHGRPELDNVYLINGDVADRGPYAIEIFALIFGYMLAKPGSVYLNSASPPLPAIRLDRMACDIGGNHESIDMNDIFNLLPLATRLNKEAMAIHGGLCRTNDTTLAEINQVARIRPVPVSIDDPEDTLFFDCVWADPQAVPNPPCMSWQFALLMWWTAEARLAEWLGCGEMRPVAMCAGWRRARQVRGARLLLRYIRAGCDSSLLRDEPTAYDHPLPRSAKVDEWRAVAVSTFALASLLVDQVQHDGRLITIFSASNYCGRIGNTGGTMLISPQLDYQLMEHWAPSVSELLELEAAEAAAAESSSEEAKEAAKLLPAADEPQRRQRRFSVEAGRLMAADLIKKMKELICTHKSQLLAFFEAADEKGDGLISIDVWLQGVREVRTPQAREAVLTQGRLGCHRRRKFRPSREALCLA